MELRQLRHFLAVVESGSFSGAAAIAGLTQQSLSKSIAALEADLGVRLFDRDTRNLTLTLHGELLLSHARNIDAEAQQIRRTIDDTLGIRAGHVRVGAGLTAASYVLPTAVSRLLSRRPGVHVHVVDGTSKSLIPMLMRGELDLIVCVIGTPIDDPLVRQDVLFQERLCLLARGGHPLAREARLKLRRTLDFPWLVGWSPTGLDVAVVAAFRKERLTPPNPRVVTTSLTLVRALLTVTDHLAVLPEHLFAPEIESGAIAVLDLAAKPTDWSRPMSICYRRNSTRSPATMALVGELTALACEPAPIPGLRPLSGKPAR